MSEKEFNNQNTPAEGELMVTITLDEYRELVKDSSARGNKTMCDIQRLTEELQTIVDTVDIPTGSISQEQYKIAIEIQRNKILQEGLDNIYDILDDIKHTREH